MSIHLLNLLPRHYWAPIGIAIIVLSHLVLLIDFPSAELFPVVITAICIMCTQKHVGWLTSAAVIAAVCVGIGQQASAAYAVPSGWPVALANAALGSARLAFVRSPLGRVYALQRLTRRLRRQSEQLQAAIEKQESTRLTVQQFESDRRTLLDHLPLHVVRKDLQGHFTFVSQSFCDFIGRPMEDILGKTDADLFSLESAKKFIEDDRKVMAAGVVFNDVECTQLPSGEMSYMQVRKAPLLAADGQIIGVQGIFWDVTEEFTRRKALQRIESLAHALIHAALDAVLIADDEGRVLEANPATQNILGFAPGGVSNHPLLGSIMQPTMEERAGRSTDPQGTSASFQRKTPINEFLKEATGRRIEARLLRNSDEWFEAEISAHPLDVEGRQNWAIFIRDITQRKKAERELRAAKESAERANAIKSEFVANVSHELRTPLTGIIGLHELLANSPVDDRQLHYLELAKISAGNLLTLIDDLLDFSKIEAGHIDIEAIEFGLVECVEEAALALAARAQLRGLELLLDLESKLPQRVVGDPHRIKQVLLNLVGNAIKFTAKGDIRICVRRVPLSTQPASARPASADSASTSPVASQVVRCRFEVHDTGVGIPNEQREMIFEAFQQADSSTTRRYGGTGLGLTICRELVTKMAGVIGIDESRRLSGQVTAGSCFYFELSLPVVGSQQLPLQSSSPATPADDSPACHIVLAAHACPWSELLCRELQDLSHSVTLLTPQQLAARQPAHLFSAGNKTIVIADYLDLCSLTWSAAPVVYKWVLLNALAYAQPHSVPNWLTHAQVSWLARPICRQSLVQALELQTPTLESRQSSAAADAASHRSADLLLVEDSPISQTVLRDMLQGLGHRVSIASHGREAIEACQHKQFDLVLMDIQMPNMDGLEATQAIRQHEQGTHKRQRIYALTAHATARDRQQCEAASMDGFLVKPITRNRLGGAIQQALSSQPNNASRPLSPLERLDSSEAADGLLKSAVDAGCDTESLASLDTATASSDARHIDIEHAFDAAPNWTELVQLMHDNESLLRDVLALLAREAPRLGRSFQSGLREGNFADVRRAVHTLKSNVRHVGLENIGHYAQWLEHLARDQQTDLLNAHMENLVALADAVADWAEQTLKSH